MKNILSYAFVVVFAMSQSASLEAQQKNANYDESKVDMGVLPDPLIGKNGQRIVAADWPAQRQFLVDTIATHQFGFGPAEQAKVTWELVETGLMFEGRTKREQFVVHLQTESGKIDIDFLLCSPTNKPQCGGFLSLNFQGNHAVDSDPAIRIPTSWMRDDEKSGVVGNRANEKGRGIAARRWPIREINERGFFVATAYYGDIDPDFDDNFQNGVHALFPNHRTTDEHPQRWGTIAGWAWGLSRLMDVLVQRSNVDAQHVAVVGHSRLGKTALWAGATDPRFALVISNNSGCGGAAIERRNIGETVAIINKAFPHWFCRNFRKYDENEKSLPHDSHSLIASIAPRPVYIASATEDRWADPKGEYLSGFYATPVYQLLGFEGLKSAEPPAPDVSVGDRVGYHSRTGAHDILLDDWTHFMNFAQRHWK